MIAENRFVRAAAARITEAADATRNAQAEGLVRGSGAFTDRFLRRVASEVDGFRSDQLRWKARAWSDPEAPERPRAEIVGSLEVDLRHYKVRKGFLARGLLMPEGARPDGDELDELRRACDAMLAATPAAFVFLYRRRDVIVVPATAVAGSLGRPDRLHRRSIGRFFEEYFSSFLGDPGVSGAVQEPLEELVRRQGARCGLALHVEPTSMPRQESLFKR